MRVLNQCEPPTPPVECLFTAFRDKPRLKKLLNVATPVRSIADRLGSTFGLADHEISFAGAAGSRITGDGEGLECETSRRGYSSNVLLDQGLILLPETISMTT